MFAVLDWPSNLGLRPSGVEHLPAALRSAGLLARLGARDAGSVAPAAAYRPERDGDTGVLNGPALHDSIAILGRAIADVILRNDTPVVLAGDCSVVLGGLLGTRLALRTRGGADSVALLFIDGHTDFYQPSASPTGEVADMDLALATGRGPAVLTTFEVASPLVRDHAVAAVGARDRTEREQAGSQRIEDSGVALFELPTIRARGMTAIADDVLRVVADGETPLFWCHIDADVLDDAVMPAVDYRQPGGLTPEELVHLLGRAAASGRMAGLSLAIYNPSLDPQAESAHLLVDILQRALPA